MLKVNESVVNALLVCSKVRLKGGGVGGDIARPIAFSLITNAALMLYEVCGCVCVWIKSERVGGGVLALCVEEVRSEAFSKFMKRLIERRNRSFSCQCQAALCSSPVTLLLNQLL